MMTWYLWQAFYQSLPRHPLFWQALSKAKVDSPRPPFNRWRSLLQAFAVLVGTMVFLVFVGIVTPLFQWLLFGIYLLPFSAALIVGGTVALNVGTAIANEQKLNRYDSLAVALPGMFGAGWALATRYLRTNQIMLRLVRLTRIFHLLCLVGLVMIALSNWWLTRSFSGSSTFDPRTLLFLLIGVVFVAVLHLDFIQATLLGAVIGMLTPTYTRRWLESSLSAVAAFLALQLGIYLLVIVGNTCVVLLLGDTDPLLMVLVLMIFSLGLVTVLHEAVFYLVWRIAENRLNLEPNTLQTFNRFGV